MDRADVTRYRPTPRQVLISTLVPAALLAVGSLVVGGTWGSVLFGATIGALVVGALRLRTGLDVTAEAAMVRGLVGRSAVPWSDVVGVDVVQRGGRKAVVLETADRLYRPSAPFSARGLVDASFEAKAGAIAQRWRTAPSAR